MLVLINNLFIYRVSIIPLPFTVRTSLLLISENLSIFIIKSSIICFRSLPVVDYIWDRRAIVAVNPLNREK
jgi:hypothetical protein